MGLFKRKCKHESVKGYSGRLPYFDIDGVITDGIGREHAWLSTICAKCGDRYTIGMVHLPKSSDKKG